MPSANFSLALAVRQHQAAPGAMQQLECIPNGRLGDGCVDGILLTQAIWTNSGRKVAFYALSSDVSGAMKAAIVKQQSCMVTAAYIGNDHGDRQAFIVEAVGA